MSKRNRRGIFYLIVLGVIISFTPRIINVLAGTPDVHISAEELKRLDEEFRQKKEQRRKSNSKSFRKPFRYKVPSSKFDPNDYTREDWMNLGLSEKQADVVLKFTRNGIDNNKELRSVYVISDELYELIKDSTVYPVKKVSRNNPVQIIVDLNSSSEEELQSLPGIGPYYAKKIKEHRTQLGGFHSTEQLLEIWKFDADKLEEIRPFITIKEDVKKISINLADVDQLKSHPYINYKVANSIVKMREMHGAYETIEDLKRSKLIDAEQLEKIRPYIKL